MKIDKINIDLKFPPVLVAEISGNHGGKLSNALKLVRKASQNGADFIKLQTYQADKLTLNLAKPGFIIKDKKSIWKKKKLFDLYKKGETKKEWHYKIFNEAKKYKVGCFTSIFDENDIEFLEKLKVPAYKIASFECLHFPLIEKVIKTKKPILISTGLCTSEEIDELVKLLKRKKCKNYLLLKCTSSYPALASDLNLNLIGDMRKKYKCEIGYSDHTIGFDAAIGAIHHGASLIEKHVSLNNKIGIDAKFSLEVEKLSLLKKAINNAFISKGNNIYGPTKNELPNLKFRRSIYAARDIKKGDKFSKFNLRIIRPGLGMQPKYYYSLIGRRSQSDIKFGNPIKMKNVKK
tara:strand:- start:496 stop:1539 length:1044 start_codon:yes stop_codon:yes gene_type:complete